MRKKIATKIVKDTKRSPERNIEIDFARIVCCVMVVLIHSPAICMGGGKIAIDALIHCAVPCFMAISGYLIFYRREYSYKQILLGPFKKYLIIFLVWYAMYVGYSYYFTDRTENIWKFAVANSEGWHLWYLKAYLQIIFVYPLVRAITARKKLTLFYSVLWFIFMPVRFTLGYLPGMEYIYLRVIQLPFFQYTGSIGGTLYAYHPLECLGIFIAGGMILDDLELICKNKGYGRAFMKRIVIWLGVGIVGYFIAIGVLYTVSKIDLSMVPMYVTCFHFYNLMVAVGVLAASYLVVSHIHSKRFCQMVNAAADKTLGIYILHPFVGQCIQKLPVVTAMEEWDGRNQLIVLLTFIFCYVITAFVHRVIPKKIAAYIF